MGQTFQFAPVLGVGDPAHRFKATALNGSENYTFDLAAGRHLMLLFFGSAGTPSSRTALKLVAENRAMFDDVSASFYGVTTSRRDIAQNRIQQSLPGIRFFLDYESRISSLYGAAPINQSTLPYRPHWLLLDPQLRVLGVYKINDGEAAFRHLAAATKVERNPSWAPILSLPNVFEPAICDRLKKLYAEQGGRASGFMRDVGGRTKLIVDPSHKVRSDCSINDLDLRQALVERIYRRIVPEIQRAFQFQATRIERYIVACYDAQSGGHFRPHRDNTTRGTSHRRFAVTINLNAEDYEGGDLRFPEFGNRTYRAPTGGAIVFSCSLLHEATPVTRGRRFAFLPFLYDEEAANNRAANNAYLDSKVPSYQYESPPNCQIDVLY